ncbi:hypothetical protein [Pyrobaculum ferrireducens]|uniref:Uncharacterized protein n=1 Tax=Pyrobaculum ferrireducens TaxID=1104324 RepID=G7VEG7_9CREN|nr:hypothetical protein [Pyrobaculum ferrireducens]AET31591.1 hypothetical protein P186_0123 [Pyrobaculum ferrireducens]
MSLCTFEKFSLCNPQVDKGEVLKAALEIGEALAASPYDLIGLAVAFGADPLEAKKKLALEISGHVKRPVATFLARYGRVHGYEKVERELLRLYQAQRGGCICPVAPLAPLGGGGYIVQRPYGVYICEGGACREVAPEPIALYEHPTGCMFYNPPLVLTDQPVAAVVNALRQLKVAEPEPVARALLPGLCRDLWGVYVP